MTGRGGGDGKDQQPGSALVIVDYLIPIDVYGPVVRVYRLISCRVTDSSAEILIAAPC
jgi:hypothetical protein